MTFKPRAGQSFNEKKRINKIEHRFVPIERVLEVLEKHRTKPLIKVTDYEYGWYECAEAIRKDLEELQ